MVNKQILKNNEERIKKVEKLMQSETPKGLRDILILAELFACKTDKGETVGDTILKSIEPKQCKTCGQIIRKEDEMK